MEFKRTTFLRVYTGEDVICNGEPLHKAIIKEARHLGLAGGTVTRGVEGFASNLRGMGRAINSFVTGNANLPMIVEIVDKRENLEKILPFLEKNATHALVIMEDCNYLVTDYIRSKENAQGSSIENK